MTVSSLTHTLALAVLFNFASPVFADPPAAKDSKAAETKSAGKPTTAKSQEKRPVELKPAETKPTARKPTYVLPDADVAAPVVAPKPLTPGGKYVEGDMKRPRPVVVAPPTASDQQRAGRPPSDAITLFDGTDLA